MMTKDTVLTVLGRPLEPVLRTTSISEWLLKPSLVGVKVLDAGGSGSFATVMAGMEWTVENRYKYNIRGASMSLGGPGLAEWASSDDDSVNRYANKMMSEGIAIFIAAGNNGVSAQIGTPGSAEDAITVGAL